MKYFVSICLICWFIGCTRTEKPKESYEEIYQSVSIPYEIRDTIRYISLPSTLLYGASGRIVYDVYLDSLGRKTGYNVKLLRFYDNDGERVFDYFDRSNKPFHIDSYPDSIRYFHDFLGPTISNYIVTKTIGNVKSNKYRITFSKIIG